MYSNTASSLTYTGSICAMLLLFVGIDINLVFVQGFEGGYVFVCEQNIVFFCNNVRID